MKNPDDYRKLGHFELANVYEILAHLLVSIDYLKKNEELEEYKYALKWVREQVVLMLRDD